MGIPAPSARDLDKDRSLLSHLKDSRENSQCILSEAGVRLLELCRKLSELQNMLIFASTSPVCVRVQRSSPSLKARHGPPRHHSAHIAYLFVASHLNFILLFWN
jgi:hypothetical protein